MTREELVQMADAELEDMIARHKRAGTKREWNRITGQQESKNDVIRDGTAHLSFLNTVAQAKGWENVWHEEEELKLPKGKVE